MTLFLGSIFQDVLVDNFNMECKNFEEFISKINRKTKGSIKTIGEWESESPVMVHARPAGEYCGVDKIFYFGDYPHQKWPGTKV